MIKKSITQTRRKMGKKMMKKIPTWRRQGRGRVERICKVNVEYNPPPKKKKMICLYRYIIIQIYHLRIKTNLLCQFCNSGIRIPGWSHTLCLTGADPGFSWGGGGGRAYKIMCAHAYHEREARSPLRPEALGVFDGLSSYLSLIFKHSETKWR